MSRILPKQWDMLRSVLIARIFLLSRCISDDWPNDAAVLAPDDDNVEDVLETEAAAELGEDDPTAMLDYFWALAGIQYWHKLVNIVSRVFNSSIDPQILTNFCSELNKVWQLVYYLVTFIAVDSVFNIDSQLPWTINLHVFCA